MGFQSAPLVGEGRKNGIERHHTDTKGFNPRPSWVRGERINRRVVLVPGSGINTIVTGTGHLEYRFLSSSFTHTATDWEVATDMNFSNIVASSYNDTVNKLSWVTTLPVGDYFMRFRYHGSNG